MRASPDSHQEGGEDELVDVCVPPPAATLPPKIRELLSINTLGRVASGSVVVSVDNGCILAPRINRFKTQSCSHTVVFSCDGCDGIDLT